MKIKERYRIREIAGEKVVIMQGAKGCDLTRIVSLNDSAAWLLDSLADREFTVDDAVRLLTGRYDVGPERARADSQRWADTLVECGLITL